MHLTQQEERLSRFLAFVLRHRPETIGVEPDDEGWISLPELVCSVAEHWRKGPVTIETVTRIVDGDAKRRYEIDTQTRPHRIRACYGHSLPVSVRYAEVTPPPVLYHGTARRFLERIRSGGLLPMGRRHVHLSDGIETALAVGRRRDGRPAVLVVAAQEMAAAGHVFYLTPGGLYLTGSVPPGFLRLLADEPE